MGRVTPINSIIMDASFQSYSIDCSHTINIQQKVEKSVMKIFEKSFEMKNPYLITSSSATGRLTFEETFIRVSYLIRCSLEVDFLSGNCLKVMTTTCALFACLTFFSLQTINHLEKRRWHTCCTSCTYQGWFMFWAHLYVRSTSTKSIQSFKFIFVSVTQCDRNMYNM